MLHTRGTELLFQQGQHYLSLKLEVRIKTMQVDEKVPAAAVAAWLSSALLGLLKWWLDNKMPCSPEQMDEITRALILPGLTSALGRER
jgi:hypothetical protein